MKLTLKAIGIALVCAVFSQTIRPEIVRVKLYKTDPTTWNKPYYYNLSNRVERITIETPIIPQATPGNKVKRAKQAAKTDKITTNRPTAISMPKSIKKDGTISFDTDEFNMLFVCSKPLSEPNAQECGKLILSWGDTEAIADAARQQYSNVPTYSLGDVIAISRDKTPTSMPKSYVEQLIKDNQAKFFKIPVHKTDPNTWGQKWTITLLDENGEPYPDATTTIAQNSDWTKKLLIQKDIEPYSTYARVIKPGTKGSTRLETPADIPWEQQMLAIDGNGEATIINKSFYKPAPKVPKQLVKKQVESSLNNQATELSGF